MKETARNNTSLYEWHIDHILKGVEAARGGEFATDAEVEEFFRRYGNAFSNGADY
jgi:predicted transcriptional regulator